MKHRNRTKDILFLSIQMLILFIFFAFPNLYRLALPNTWHGVGIFLAVLGFVLSIMGAITLKNMLSPYISPSPKGELITTGIYRRIRHPIYLGILIFLFGFTLIFGSVSKFIIFLIAVIFFVKKALEEERLLLHRYPKYSNYKQRTGMFLPKIF